MITRPMLRSLLIRCALFGALGVAAAFLAVLTKAVIHPGLALMVGIVVGFLTWWLKHGLTRADATDFPPPPRPITDADGASLPDDPPLRRLNRLMDTATAGDRNSLAHVGRTLSTIVQQAITQADAAGIDLQVPASLRAYASATTADTPPTPAPQDLPRLISDLDAATRSLYERTSA